MAAEQAVENAVLIVDDDPMVRGCLGAFVSRAGYSVRLAENGAQGLRILERDADTIRLVVLDYQMPGIDGRQTAELMNQIAPLVPRILLTGSMSLLGGDHWVADLFVEALEKPADPWEFVALVKRIARSERGEDETGMAAGEGRDIPAMTEPGLGG